jgi:hypothetical protein
MEIESKKDFMNPGIAIVVTNYENKVLATLFSRQSDVVFKLTAGVNKIRFTVNDFPLSNGLYKLGVWLSSDNSAESDYLEDALRFEVFPADFYGNGYQPISQIHGPYCIRSKFDVI